MRGDVRWVGTVVAAAAVVLSAGTGPATAAAGRASAAYVPLPPPQPRCGSSPLVRGAIAEAYERLTRSCGVLGSPLTPELTTPDGRGRYNHFQHGSIYWTPSTGAHEVHGMIRDTWARMGWERSVLGYPTTDETWTFARQGAYNHFERGSIFWSPATSAHEVHGDIARRYGWLGGSTSALGFPVTDELATVSRHGAVNHFQSGSMYWSPATGAHEVRGAIRDAWVRAGGERSALGFPLSDEYEFFGQRRSDFEWGSLLWTEAGGTRVVWDKGAELSGKVTVRELLMTIPTYWLPDSRFYTPGDFGGAVDADGDGCDSRAEVLTMTSSVPVEVGEACEVRTGRWVSAYDGSVLTQASDVVVDHVVTFADAWESGAWRWTQAQRVAFANELTPVAALQVATPEDVLAKNTSWGVWLPTAPELRCAHVTRWVLMKYRWRLTADDAEPNTLWSVLNGACGDQVVDVPARAL